MMIQETKDLSKICYFLLYSHDKYWDANEWVGIYDDVRDLKAAYDEELGTQDYYFNSQLGYILLIFEMLLNKKGYKRVTPEELWGDKEE